LGAGKKLLWEEAFGGQNLPLGWKTARSAKAGSSLGLAGGELVIAAPANAAAFVEHPLPAGTALITCWVDPRTDHGATWGPGLALRWADDRTLRVNVRSEGRFGVDAGKQQLLEGVTEPGRPCRLAITLEEQEVVAYAAQDTGPWQELARFPRHEFPGDPAAVRLGKMSPSAKNEDFSTLGPDGICAFRKLQALGQ
jgi:hypothetical protein